MQIRLIPRQRRNHLTCVREDGSFTHADLGPGLPHHDLAHFVVERAFGLRRGFFGHIAAGYTMQELNQKDVIQRLPPEAWHAEVLARALGSLETGACTPGQFGTLIEAELGAGCPARLLGLTAERAQELLAEHRTLMARYESLAPGESLELEFA